MSETTNAPVGAEPSLVQSAPVVPAATPSESTVSMSSAALKARLDEERSKAKAALLKEFGYESQADLKAVLAAAKAKQDAELTETQRLAKALDDLKPRAERADKLERSLAALVEAQFSALPEKAREAIDGVANGNPEERLRMMEVFRQSGLLSASAAASTAPPAAAPVTTTPGPAPRPAAMQTPWDKYQELQKRNPLLASAFFQANRAAIDESRPAQ